MERPELAGVHHVKVPVTDLARSRRWYEEVFGFQAEVEFPDDDGVVRGIAGTVPGLEPSMLAMRENPTAATGCAGFDPFSFAVHGREDIEAWIDHLDQLSVEHSTLIEASIGWLLVFHDPDGMEIHLYTWAEHGRDHSDRPGYGRQVRAGSS
jgi:catechol 2,3-dioxygenase-like lactoylglutathione lyase family enzyme